MEEVNWPAPRTYRGYWWDVRRDDDGDRWWEDHYAQSASDGSYNASVRLMDLNRDSTWKDFEAAVDAAFEKGDLPR